jgi:hypothetical protein
LPDLIKKSKFDFRSSVTGALLTVVGGLASFRALSFDGESRFFPLAVALALAVTGTAILVHALLTQRAVASSAEKYTAVLLAAAIVTAWATAFSGGMGFVLPTFVMQASLLWITGVRRPVHIAFIAVLVTALAYMLFVKLLDIPMPASLLPNALQGF